MSVYSFNDVNATIVGPGGNIDLAYGAGASEEGISIEMAGDKNTMTIGGDGDGMHSLHADKSGTITCRFLKTSPTNSQLQTMYDTQTLNGATHGQNVIEVNNVRSLDNTVARQVAFKKKPAVHYRKTGDIMEWVFDCIKIDTILGVYPQ